MDEDEDRMRLAQNRIKLAVKCLEFAGIADNGGEADPHITPHKLERLGIAMKLARHQGLLEPFNDAEARMFARGHVHL